MAETTHEIETTIDRTREDLADNLRELEDKVRSAADWKEYFDANPALFLGLAFGGALLVGSILAGRTPRSYAGAQVESETSTRAPHRERAHETVELIKGALLGVAVSRLTQFMDSMLPGFGEHYRRAEAEARHSY